MLPSILTCTAIAITCCGLAALFTRRLPLYQINGLMSLGNALSALSNILTADTTAASVSAGFAALSGWLWWKGGGGDDTKRRLKRWARRFQGVRRTAPSHA